MLRVALALMIVACHAGLAPVPTSRLADLDDSYTEEDQRRAASAKACPAIVKPRLWRIEKDGKTSHVFGTYHVGVGRDRLPDVVVDAFMKARVIAFESLNDDNSSDGPPRSPRPLREELGPAAWARLVALFGAEYAPALEEQSAMAVILLMTIMYIDFEAALDDELEEAAKRLDKPVVALESGASLAPLIGRWLNANTLRAELMKSRGRRALREKSLQSLADYCAGRDREETDRFEHEGTGMTKAEVDKLKYDLLEGRNRSWMIPMEPLLAEGNAFIAVGAAHLRGSGSVLELLSKRGYRVTRVD